MPDSLEVSMREYSSSFFLSATVRRSAWPPPPLRPEELLHIECLLALKYVVSCPSKFMSEDGERLGFAVFPLQPLFVFHPFWISFQEHYRGFRERLFEMNIPDLASGSAISFPGGFSGTLDQSAVRCKVLYSREAVNVTHLVENRQG